MFIGYNPNTEIFKDFIDLNSKGYIKTNEAMETSITGIYAVGDCRDKLIMQVATAVGDGAVAGCMAEKYIEELDFIEKHIIQSKKLVIILIYDASVSNDRDYLERLETIETLKSDKIDFKKIDIYKSYNIALSLGFSKSLQLVIMKDGKMKKIIHNLDNIENEIEDIIEKFL